jgi:predicted  nucleic acid-binding Zn-ribbon protein
MSRIALTSAIVFSLIYPTPGLNSLMAGGWRPPHWTPPRLIDPTEPIRRKIQQAQQQLDGVQHQLADLSNRIVAQRNLVQRTQDAVNGLSSSLADANHRLSQARLGAAQAAGVLKAAEDEVRGLTQLRDEAKKALDQANEELSHLTDSLKSSKLLAYDLMTDAVLSYNVVHGAFYAKVDLPGGASYDSEKLKDWVRHGQPSLPQGNPIEVIFGAFGVDLQQTSGYASHRGSVIATHPTASIYFASRRFVDWMSPETAADYTIKIVSTGQLGAEDAIQQAQDMLLLEFQDVMAWAYLQGMEDLESMAAAALEALATRKGFEVDDVKLNLGWEEVKYDYNPQLTGMTEFPLKLLPGGSAILSKTNQALIHDRLTLTSPHAAFSVVWSNPLRDHKAVAEALLSAKRSELAAKYDALLLGALDKVTGANLPKDQMKRLDSLLLQTGDPTPAGVAGKLEETFKIDPAWIKQAIDDGKYFVDLKDKPIGTKLTAFLRPLAMGNEGSAMLQELEIDLATGRIFCRFSLRHKHSWGNLEQALAALNDWATQTGHTASVSLDTLIDDLDFDASRTLIDARKKSEKTVSTAATKLNDAATRLQAETNAIPGLRVQLNNANAAVSNTTAQVHNLEIQLGNESRALTNAINALNSLLSQQISLNNEAAHLRDLINGWRRQIHL